MKKEDLKAIVTWQLFHGKQLDEVVVEKRGTNNLQKDPVFWSHYLLVLLALKTIL
jgi:hypothetical protein